MSSESQDLNLSRVSDIICKGEEDLSLSVSWASGCPAAQFVWTLFFSSLLLSCISPDYTWGPLKAI